ncbi:NUDIX hydrolase [Aminithiophilus ramosus]|uniref:NUDIX hydrolase n=2 Tax=Synergistales TaxID=649776 RepID=A0A9Q7A9A7_9BACT|nr:NUDIX hydrolase [Aminithiophilus ramosus]QTX31233.1 NUDIX hydrolase [Aminithiophilus ramosus]QVL35033.1 NUDIX hydrolase [Synergistota bacterium]
MDPKETALSSKTLFEGRIVTLRVDEVELDSGHRTTREVITHAPAVALIALTDRGEIFLVRQYRHPVGRVILEIPAGLVEPGEEPRETARRELMEEVGQDAGRIEEIGRFYSSPGFSDEVIILFLATELTPRRLEADDDEDLRVLSLPLEDFAQALDEEEIKDSKTVAALWWLQAKGLAPCSGR